MESISPYVRTIVNSPLSAILKTIKGITKGNDIRNVKNLEQESVV
jgi:MerR family transcriptional regulator, light-induced transcriptional regulator